MLLEYIERARRQPKEVKRRIVWLWSLVLTGCIVLVWLSVIIGRQYAEDGGVVRDTSVDIPATPIDTTSQFKASNQFLNTPNTAPADFPTVFDQATITSPSVSTTSPSTSTPALVPKDEVGNTSASTTPELWP